MNLSKAPQVYSAQDQDTLRFTLEAEDKKNLKEGHVFSKILMRDTATGAVKTVVITSDAFVIT